MVVCIIEELICLVLNVNKSNKIFLVILGVLIAIACFFIPIKIAMFLVVATFFAVFTFYSLEISFGAFIVVMSIAPHEIWNNIIILLVSVFYLLVFYLQVLASKRKGLTIKSISVPLLFFVFFGFYSLFISFDFGDSLRVFIILLSCIILSIVLMGIVRDKKTLDMFLAFICIAVFLTCLYGIYQKIVGVEVRAEFIDIVASDGEKQRIYSTMDNPNNYAEYLVLFLPLVFAYFLNTRDEIKKLLILFIGFLGMVLLVLTLSRSAYVTFAFGAALFVLLVNKKIVPFCIILSVAAIPLIPDMIINRLMTIGKDSSSKYRIYIWDSVFKMLRVYWYKGIGIGPGAFKKIYDNYPNPNASRVMHAHNLILQIFLEMGIGGIISFLALMFSNLKDNFMGYLNTKDLYFKNMFSGFIFSLVAITAFSFGEYVWYYPRVLLSFWIVMGLSFATINFAKEETK